MEGKRRKQKSRDFFLNGTFFLNKKCFFMMNSVGSALNGTGNCYL